MSTHRGKIGRLPTELREQVNRRLENGEKGSSIVAWLNSLPEVQAILAMEFYGKPIREQNLSDWRKHGYKDWACRREALSMAAEIGELPVAGNSSVVDQTATWASVRYLMAVREVVQNRAEGVSNLDTIRQFTRDVIALRRLEHRGARLEFEKERVGMHLGVVPGGCGSAAATTAASAAYGGGTGPTPKAYDANNNKNSVR